MTIPLVGLGTWKLWGKECEETIDKALEIGYRHIDTADNYNNHKEIGRAIKAVPREQLFITTKITIDDLEPDRVKEVVPRFLEELDIPYVDLLLIHWPNPSVNLAKTLEAMVPFKENEMTRHIGVSNFSRKNLKEVAAFHSQIHTNQIELHPYLQRKDLVTYCQDNGIGITAYRPVAKGAFESDNTLLQIGHLHGKSPSQVALRWLIQQGFPAIPKASSMQHLKDNLNIFDFNLSAEEIEQIASLDCGKRFCAPEGMPIGED